MSTPPVPPLARPPRGWRVAGAEGGRSQGRQGLRRPVQLGPALTSQGGLSRGPSSTLGPDPHSSSRGAKPGKRGPAPDTRGAVVRQAARALSVDCVSMPGTCPSLLQQAWQGMARPLCTGAQCSDRVERWQLSRTHHWLTTALCAACQAMIGQVLPGLLPGTCWLLVAWGSSRAEMVMGTQGWGASSAAVCVKLLVLAGGWAIVATLLGVPHPRP
ncbi:hypothetical protein V8C86DRAFT_1494638 [Haematococcus lacustris]